MILLVEWLLFRFVVLEISVIVIRGIISILIRLIKIVFSGVNSVVLWFIVVLIVVFVSMVIIICMLMLFSKFFVFNIFIIFVLINCKFLVLVISVILLNG